MTGEKNCSQPLATGQRLTYGCAKFSDYLKINKDSTALKDHQQLQNNQLISQRRIHRNRLLIASASLIALNFTAYQPFKQAWWEEERSHFHFYRGWRRTEGSWDFGCDDQLYGYIDKMGHFYCSRILSDQMTYFSRWIGFGEKSCKIIGPVMSSLLMLEIEIYDGYFKEWGFSPADFAANELGAFWPLIEEKIPYLKNFQFKLSYHPSNLPKSEATFVKDYSGMTFWLSWNVRTLMPEKMKQVYPTWLNLALGYSTSRQTHGDVELYLAPDINWEKIPIGKSAFAIYFKRALNYLHFPCFAVKFQPESKFYPIYF